jgi:hypothetical protein
MWTVSLSLPVHPALFLQFFSFSKRFDPVRNRPLFWEKGVKTSATDAASANVTSDTAEQGGKPIGNASNQINGLNQSAPTDLNGTYLFRITPVPDLVPTQGRKPDALDASEETPGPNVRNDSGVQLHAFQFQCFQYYLVLRRLLLLHEFH